MAGLGPGPGFIVRSFDGSMTDRRYAIRLSLTNAYGSSLKFGPSKLNLVLQAHYTSTDNDRRSADFFYFSK
jgi:hypothetical protein